MAKQKPLVLIGLSGGVDSSVAALLLKKKGYNVIGAFMKNYSDTEDKFTGECSYLNDLKSAQKVAVSLGIPLHVFDFEYEYKKKVINPMFKKYASFKTPNPDVLCNATIKFPLLWREAKKLGANFIATGHYARIKKTKKGYALLAGKDKEKDQSYFLARLSQKDLSHTIFPLANLTKKQVRLLAKRHHLHNWDRPSTRGICFVGKVSMQKFLRSRIHSKYGKVLSPSGKVVGTHEGLAYYTIGQKAGPHIGINMVKTGRDAQKRWYVAAKKKNNIIIVAPEDHSSLNVKEIYIKNMHLINPRLSLPKEGLKARIRYRGNLIPTTLFRKKNKIVLRLNCPQTGVASGQIIVLYKNSEVVACGEIEV